MKKYYRRKSSKSRKLVRKNSKMRRNRKNRNTRKMRGGDHDKTHIIKLWSSSCGYCISLNTVWPEVVDNSDSTKIMFHDVDAEMEGANSKLSALNKELGTDKIKVMSGYPTLLKLKNKVVTNYEGPRDKESLIQWVKE
jgi:thiol-disulfide isomerase/thioredoxin